MFVETPDLYLSDGATAAAGPPLPVSGTGRHSYVGYLGALGMFPT